MNKEKKVRQHKVLSNPIAAMFLLMIWGLAFYQLIGGIFQIALGARFTGYAAALAAVLALVIHKAWFAPEFKGAIGAPGFRSKDVMVAFFGFAAIIIALDLIGFIGHEVAFSLTILGNALMAGIGEEMAIRVLPISVMMRDWMDEKHIPIAAYSTAVIFGLVHFANMGNGAGFVDTLFQVIVAIGFGVMFAAVYLRTGNILLCMILHTAHDLLVFMIVGVTSSSGVIQGTSGFDMVTDLVIGVLGVVVGTYLIRKSVRADIVEVWKERWSR